MKGNVMNYLLENYHVSDYQFQDLDYTDYKTIHELIKYKFFKLCGCCHASTYNFCWDVLNNVSDIENTITNDSWSATEFLVCYLNEIKLLEHGSGVRGSWLSDYGKDVLENGSNEIVKNKFCQQILIYLKDSDGCTFDTISEWMEEDIENVTNLLIDIFNRLGLLEGLELTNDGTYIVEQGHMEESED